MANDGGHTAAIALTWTFVLVMILASCLLIYFFDCCCCFNSFFEYLPEHWKESKSILKGRRKKMNRLNKKNKNNVSGHMMVNKEIM